MSREILRYNTQGLDRLFTGILPSLTVQIKVYEQLLGLTLISCHLPRFICRWDCRWHLSTSPGPRSGSLRHPLRDKQLHICLEREIFMSALRKFRPALICFLVYLPLLKTALRIVSLLPWDVSNISQLTR